MAEHAAVVMAKESDFVLLNYLDFLDRAGFSEIVLIADGGASEAVRARLRDRPPEAAPVRLREPDPAFWREALGAAVPNVVRKQRLVFREELGRLQADWTFIADADEFPEVPEVFRALDRAPAEAEAVSLPPAEAVWGPDERDAPPFATRCFRVPPRRRRLWRLLRPLIYGDLHRLFESNMLAHREGKQFLRKGARFDDISPHVARRDGRVLNRRLEGPAARLRVRHYDAVSLDRWLEKMRARGAEPPSPGMRPHRRAQLEFVRGLLARMEAAPTPEAARRLAERAFRRLYHLSWPQYVLLRLIGGVVRLPPVREAAARGARPPEDPSPEGRPQPSRSGRPYSRSSSSGRLADQGTRACGSGQP